MMTEDQKRKIGGKIHKILNEAYVRRLTFKEHKRLIKLIGKLFDNIP